MTDPTPSTLVSGEDPWLTVQQVSDELAIHPATVRVWIKQGRLQAVRAGKGFRLRRSEVERALGAPRSRTPVEEQPYAISESDTSASARPAPRQVADQLIAIAPPPGTEG